MGPGVNVVGIFVIYIKCCFYEKKKKKKKKKKECCGKHVHVRGLKGKLVRLRR